MHPILTQLRSMFSMFHELGILFKQPKYRAVLIWILGIILVGTIFYRLIEGWSWLDSLYFSLVTLSTVGYGDLSPTTPVSKIFTMFYIFSGIGIFAAFGNMLLKERGLIKKKHLLEKEAKSNEGGHE